MSVALDIDKDFGLPIGAGTQHVTLLVEVAYDQADRSAGDYPDTVMASFVSNMEYVEFDFYVPGQCKPTMTLELLSEYIYKLKTKLMKFLLYSLNLNARYKTPFTLNQRSLVSFFSCL